MAITKAGGCSEVFLLKCLVSMKCFIKRLVPVNGLKSPLLYCHEFVRHTDGIDASAVYSYKYFSLLSFLVSEKAMKPLKKNLSNFINAVTEREDQRTYFY